MHTLLEMQLLQSRFPQYIKLYMAYKDDIALGGTLLYITKQVVHTQYISANVEGKELGVLDLLFDYLINHEYTNYPYFDFGQSTEQMGHLLNVSLIFRRRALVVVECVMTFMNMGCRVSLCEFDSIFWKSLGFG